MKTGNNMSIRAPYDRVFELGANVEDWARILPHYRYVRVLARDGANKTVKMSAMRDFIPVTWSAIETVVEGSSEKPGRIEFRHIRGLVRGMYVEWSFKVDGDRVLVTITHDLRAAPIPNTPIGRQVDRDHSWQGLHRLHSEQDSAARKAAGRGGKHRKD